MTDKTDHEIVLSPLTPGTVPGTTDPKRPSEAEAHEAVRTLLAWAGDDPSREGLIETPKRVCNAYREWFRGYRSDPGEILNKTFEETDNYSNMVVVDGIQFESHCEHHMVPIIGTAVVGYIPRGRVVGLSKLARVVDAYAKRLIVQERMTEQIAEAIDNNLEPHGVGVVVAASHLCMSTRGAYKPKSFTTTSALRGYMMERPEARAEFLTLAQNRINL